MEDEDPDDEDMLFCRIIMKKLKKMDEHRKEMAKAKILETLVQVQYGWCIVYIYIYIFVIFILFLLFINKNRFLANKLVRI